MNFYAKLIVALALVAGISAGLLAATYQATAPVIEERDREEREKALQTVFFLQTEKTGAASRLTLIPKEMNADVVALYENETAESPAYYAVRGEAIGYNAGSPIVLLVGFTNPSREVDTLLTGYVADDAMPRKGDYDAFVVGFSVLSSEETPGLGERVKDVRPPYTWLQLLTGNRPPETPDKATHFQRQFRGLAARNMRLKKNGGDLDAITASTITSTAVVTAIQDARDKLAETLDGEQRAG